jgi:hypothetical protein
MPTSLRSIIGAPRHQRFLLTTSNAALPVPSWAQGGKGALYVSGCGGGGGRGGGNGGFGGSGAFAVDHPVVIPSGVITVSAVVGAAGAAAPDADSSGGNGGSTSVTLGGVLALNLGGGVGGQPTSNGGSGGAGGTPSVYGTVPTFTSNVINGAQASVTNVYAAHAEYLRSSRVMNTLSYGVSGLGGGITSNTGGACFTPFGGANGGYGSSGSPAGRQGVLILTFVEGL